MFLLAAVAPLHRVELQRHPQYGRYTVKKPLRRFNDASRRVRWNTMHLIGQSSQSTYCRFINSCFDAKSAAIKIEKCGKIEKFAQALNEGISSRGKSTYVPTKGAETSRRDDEDAASTMGGGAERTSARETGPEAPRVLVRPSQPRRLVPRCPALLWDGSANSSTC